jgi:rhamnose utilization protein RhaD (predicted bifunctional aldolase and dehydrogenase)/NAD(P)-dependent dehydrogenase (short-subunit alcohol dehydrogenase family)
MTDAIPEADQLEPLLALSRACGADPAVVLAGGGNTSVKADGTIYVTASGTALATVGPADFVPMDATRLRAVLEGDLPADPREREELLNRRIRGCVLEPWRHPKPSIECILHALIPAAFVVHTHPAEANTLSCCVRGRELAAELFGDDLLWQDYADPGHGLAAALREGIADWSARTGRAYPPAILIQNHGLFAAAETADGIRQVMDRILGGRVAERAGGRAEPFGPVTRLEPEEAARQLLLLAPALRGLLSETPRRAVVRFDDDPDVLRLAGAEGGEAATEAGPLGPDHIAYAGSFPLWFDPVPGEAADQLVPRLREAIESHRARRGFLPTIVLARGLGLFAAGPSVREAETARAVYRNVIDVAAGAQRLGGIHGMSDAGRRFVEGWETEGYKAAAARAAPLPRAAGRVALVTGAAQGFGLEIARALVREGACVLLGDINAEGARAAARTLSDDYGAGRAGGAGLDVADARSLREAVRLAVRLWGGLDLLVANAGVLRAGSVLSQSEDEIDFVTAVNYKGYVLSVQAVAPVMAVQHAARPETWSDIIQVNSKSGLAGSNRNFAYAGSKFGGIGLTQSFALELVDSGIKVNAVCPGNFYDGPLWSDPENGLFVQYLRAGKVPGATTVEDVRRAYEARSPIHRGCTAEDVMHAILYLMDQQFETGQALPVTGGQIMLH